MRRSVATRTDEDSHNDFEKHTRRDLISLLPPHVMRAAIEKQETQTRKINQDYASPAVVSFQFVKQALEIGSYTAYIDGNQVAGGQAASAHR